MTVYRVVNADWATAGDGDLIRSQAKGADVLVVVEARDHDNDPVRVDWILNRQGQRREWRVFQNLRDGSRAGTAIAVRRGSTVKVRRVRGAMSRLTRLSRQGRKVQARYERTVYLRDEHGPVTVIGFHLPLHSTGLQASAVRALHQRWNKPGQRRLAMGDANMRHDRLRHFLVAPHSYGADVMAAVWSGDWPRTSSSHHKARGSDHEVLTLRTHTPY